MYKRIWIWIAGLGFAATVAYAAATGDRLKTPVMVGQGNTSTKEIDFDSGSGSSNAKITSTTASTMNLNVNGTTQIAVTPTAATFTSPLYAPDGGSSAPGITFNSDTSHDTGFYRIGENSMGVSTGSVVNAEFTSSSVRFEDGSATVPMITWISTTDGGLYRPSGTHGVGVTASGSSVAEFTSTGVNIKNTTGLNFNGGGGFKVALYSGSLGASASCSGTCGPGSCGSSCPSISGISGAGAIYGVFGWAQFNGSAFTQTAIKPNVACTPSGDTLRFGSNGGTQTIDISNCDSTTTNTYRLMVFYN